MPRPRKAESEKRSYKLSIYLTEAEHITLAHVANSMDRPVAHVVVEAIRQWLDRLANPPEPVRQARYGRVMDQDDEMLRGFVCGNGHPFWVVWTWPSPPHCCPVCGAREVKRTWDGVIRRGI
ncbi:MAG: hypothetical protein K6T83_05830 [Alicyclobacillus sp.]|nr:hypothetical protein [Alicyclobacillus sp.]